MSYWVCPDDGCESSVVLFPDCVGYAAALVSVQITEGEFTANSQFTADGCDPAGFVDRVCERLTLTWDSTRDHNRTRKRPTDDQPTIGEWSA